MMKQRQREQVQRGCAVGTSGWLADLMLGAGMVLSAAGEEPPVRSAAAGPHAAASPRRVPQALRGFFCWPHGPLRQKKTGLLHISVGQSCLAARGRRMGFRGFRKGAAQRAVFFSSGASGLFSRFSSGISSLLMMVSICSSFFTSSLGKRLFTRWTTVLR